MTKPNRAAAAASAVCFVVGLVAGLMGLGVASGDRIPLGVRFMAATILYLGATALWAGVAVLREGRVRVPKARVVRRLTARDRTRMDT